MYLRLLKYYAEILRWEHLGVDATRRLQVQKFRRIFEHARVHSKFYRELYGDAGVLDLEIRGMQDIERLPVIDKQSIRLLPSSDIVTVPLGTKGLREIRTSGSTGEPMTLYSTGQELYTSHVRAFRTLQRCGYTPFQLLTSVYRYDSDAELAIERDLGLLPALQKRLGLLQRKFISVFEPVDQIIEELRGVRTDLLWSTPSIMKIVAGRLRDQDLELDIPVMLAQSETLFPPDRAILEERIAHRVVSTYGLQESPSVAVDSREEGLMDVFAESVLVEYIPGSRASENRPGELLVSNLVNRTTPIIRYATGDLCHPVDDPRFPNRVIGRVLGRMDDTLRLRDGTEFAHHQAYFTFFDFEPARHWKLVGTHEGIELHIQLEPRYRSREAEVIRLAKERWRKRCPNEPLRVVFTDEFGIDPRTGKSKLVEDRTRE